MKSQLDLKNKFISGELADLDFLKGLMELDQSHQHHPECFDNIKVLEGNEIKNLFLNKDIKTKSRYLYDLRFYHFHAFQNLSLVQKMNYSQAKKHLRYACELGDRCHELNPDREDLFLPYMRATLCYVENDLEGLERYLNILEMVDPSHSMYVNTEIIQRLKEHITKNGKPDYGIYSS